IEKSNIYDQSEYTDGTGFNITYYNPTKKTIKYITTNVIGYNAVEDPIKDVSGKIKIKIKGVGPIKPNESAKYSYDYLWLTDLVEDSDIISIHIQYMDGSSKTVKSIKQATFDRHALDILKKFNEDTE
ncbi:MAG: hypothetical protein U1D97_10575, partial [Desulfuromonadales bacterium]|nr:hypothetical protein [Desulfuromonadales bacterium]